jgi:hypothetical protein
MSFSMFYELVKMKKQFNHHSKRLVLVINYILLFFVYKYNVIIK